MAGGEWIKEMIVNLTMDPKNKKRQAYRTLDSDLDYDIQTRSMNWPLFGGMGWGGGGVKRRFTSHHAITICHSQRFPGPDSRKTEINKATQKFLIMSTGKL